MDTLEWLQAWYLKQCDGDWEHGYGVKIDTLDNPGWIVSISLIGTELEGRTFNKISRDTSETDWIRCSLKDNSFEARAGPLNLREILDIFRKWASE
jgi:hypothetical protein